MRNNVIKHHIPLKTIKIYIKHVLKYNTIVFFFQNKKVTRFSYNKKQFVIRKRVYHIKIRDVNIIFFKCFSQTNRPFQRNREIITTVDQHYSTGK